MESTDRPAGAEQREAQVPLVGGAKRAWLDCSGKTLDVQACLAALGRGGAHRMAIPLAGR